MAKNVNHVSLIKSTSTAMTSGDSVFIMSGQTGPKLPAPSALVQGEIAVNLATGVETLSIKNADNEIVTFSSDKIIKKVIVDNEMVTAAALNDLEVNKQDVLTAGEGIDITENVISATFELTVDEQLNSGSSNPVANSAITAELTDINNTISANSLVTSAALNYLNDRVNDKLDASAYTETDLTGYATEEWVEDKLGSGFTGENSGITVTQAMNETEMVIAAALNDLEANKLDVSAYTEPDLSIVYQLSGVVSANSVVTAAALNDLNDRLEDIESIDVLTSITANFATLMPSGGNVNLGTVVSSMTLNGNNVNILNGAAALTGVATTSDLLSFADNAVYDSNQKKIFFKNGNTTLTSMTIDATAFIKDGMVDDVEISTPTSGTNSGVTCLVVTFNTDAGKEDIEIPLTDMFDPSLFYTKVEIDEKLGSGFTGANSGVSVTEVIEENELAIAAALNDLESRKMDASAYTGVEVDSELSSGSSNPVANSAITNVIRDNEEVVAEALADLDSRISGNTTYINQVDAKADTIARSLSGYTPSGYSYSKSEVDVKLNDKLDVSAYTQVTVDSGLSSSSTNPVANSAITANIVELNDEDVYEAYNVPTAESVRDAIIEVETVAAAALNDLNTKKLDASAYTEGVSDLYALSGTVTENAYVTSVALNDLNDRLNDKLDAADLQGYATEQWVEGKLGSGFTGANSGVTVTEAMEANEEAVAAALADLDERISANTTTIGLVDDKVDVVASALTRYTPSGYSYSKSEVDLKLNDKLDASAYTPTDLTGYATEAWVGDRLGSAFTGANSGVSVTQLVNGKIGWESVDLDLSESSENPVQNGAITRALNNKMNAVTFGSGLTVSNNVVSVNIDTDVSGWTSGSTGVPATSALTEVLEEIEEVTATALNDLNVRVDEIEAQPEYYVARGTYSSANGTLTLEHGQIFVDGTTITSGGPTVLITGLTAGGGGGGGEENVISGISVNNVAQTPVNKVVNITVPTKLSDITSAHTHSEYALNTSFTAHTADTNAHVTTAQTSAWDGAVTNSHTHSNKSVLDGITSTKVSNWDTAYTSAHTHSNKSVLDGITTAKTAQWDNAISAVSFNGTDATVTNHKAAITATIPTSLSQLTSAHTHAISEVTNLQSTLDAKVSGVTVNGGSKISPTNGVLALTGIATTANVSTHSGTTIPSATSSQMHLPAVTAADNGKILMVVNGQWALVNPTTIYTGTGTPNQNQGNDGDIYLQTS